MAVVLTEEDIAADFWMKEVSMDFILEGPVLDLLFTTMNPSLSGESEMLSVRPENQDIRAMYKISDNELLVFLDFASFDLIKI